MYSQETDGNKGFLRPHPCVGPSVPPGNQTPTAKLKTFRRSSFVVLYGTFLKNKYFSSLSTKQSTVHKLDVRSSSPFVDYSLTFDI